MNNTRKQFTYTKENGSVSERDVFILAAPYPDFFGIDLSEYSAEERDFYAEQLEQMYADIKLETDSYLKHLGLKNNYRRFKADGVS